MFYYVSNYIMLSIYNCLSKQALRKLSQFPYPCASSSYPQEDSGSLSEVGGRGAGQMETDAPTSTTDYPSLC